jgi:hypothetical protein
MRLGIDLDTALVDYRRPLAAAAAERGLLPTGFGGSRHDLYRLVMGLPNGGAEWRRLMGLAEGRLMGLAELAEGAGAVLGACRDRGIDVVLLSLRPPAAAFDPDRTDLWAAATDWLARHGAFRADGFAIPHGNLVFAASRRSRLDAIVASGCSHFVDADDDDTRDPFFVPGVERLLLGAGGWDAIAAALFGGE